MSARRRFTCPHCGDEHDVRFAEFHVSHCLASPDVRATIMAALADEAHPGAAVARDEYKRRSAGMTFSANTLTSRFGKWTQVCAAFGLKPPVRRNSAVSQCDSAEARELAQRREEAKIASLERKLLEAEKDFRGLAVRRVRTLPNGDLAMELW